MFTILCALFQTWNHYGKDRDNKSNPIKEKEKKNKKKMKIKRFKLTAFLNPVTYRSAF